MIEQNPIPAPPADNADFPLPEGLKERIPFHCTELLPHGAPFALIDTITDIWHDGGETVSVVHSDNPVADSQGHIGNEALIEYAAQSCAVIDSSLSDNERHPGFLVEVMDSRYGETASVGDEIKVRVSTSRKRGQFRVVVYHVCVNGKFAAEGSMKLCMVENDTL